MQFAAAGGFDSKVSVGAYNSSMHVKSNVGANVSSGNTPKNNKFVSQTGGAGGKSQVDVGGGTILLDAVTTAQAALKINFAHGSGVATSGCIFYSYDGSTPATAAPNVDFRCAEVGNTNFTQAEGSGAALALADQASNTSHDFFIVPSASPEAVGLKSFAVRMELTYS